PDGGQRQGQPGGPAHERVRAAAVGYPEYVRGQHVPVRVRDAARHGQLDRAGAERAVAGLLVDDDPARVPGGQGVRDLALRLMRQVAVCGPAECSEQDRTAAYRVGELLADARAVTVCGGGTGVMAAVTAGARSRRGLVVAVRADSSQAAEASVTVATNLGQARNAVIVESTDAVIVVGGSWGTL